MKYSIVAVSILCHFVVIRITNCHFDSLHSFQILAEKPSTSRDQQLNQLNNVYKEMFADLQKRLNRSDDLVGILD